jgi:hypothetical protein
LDGVREIFRDEDGRSTRVAGFVQNHTVGEAEHPDGGDPKYFDVIDQFFLDGPGNLATLGSDPALLASMRALEHSLTDTSRTRAFVGETVLNIP